MVFLLWFFIKVVDKYISYLLLCRALSRNYVIWEMEDIFSYTSTWSITCFIVFSFTIPYLNTGKCFMILKQCFFVPTMLEHLKTLWGYSSLLACKSGKNVEVKLDDLPHSLAILILQNAAFKWDRWMLHKFYFGIKSILMSKCSLLCVSEFSDHFRGAFMSVDLLQPGIWLSICDFIAAARFLQTPVTSLTYDGNREYSLVQTRKYI